MYGLPYRTEVLDRFDYWYVVRNFDPRFVDPVPMRNKNNGFIQNQRPV